MRLTEQDIARFWEKVDRRGTTEHPDCWIWTGSTNQTGYGQMHLGSLSDGTRRPQLAHRIAWVITHQEIPDGLYVLHRCDVPSCVNPSHLWLGTADDNSKDMVAKGRHYSLTHPELVPRGEQSGRYTHPERTSRGDSHYARLHPEKLARGERVGSAKLTEAKVKEIFELRELGWTTVAIGHHFGIDHTTVGDILHRRLWKHVPIEEDLCHFKR